MIFKTTSKIPQYLAYCLAVLVIFTIIATVINHSATKNSKYKNNKFQTAKQSPKQFSKQSPKDSKNLSWQSLKGDTIALSDYSGKWIVINYWATWCPPCLTEMPELQSFYQKNQDRLIVIGVAYEDSKNTVIAKKIKNLVRNLKLTFPIVYTNPKNFQRNATDFGTLIGMPTTVILNPENQIIYNHTAPLTEKRLAELIPKLIPLE